MLRMMTREEFWNRWGQHPSEKPSMLRDLKAVANGIYHEASTGEKLTPCTKSRKRGAGSKG